MAEIKEAVLVFREEIEEIVSEDLKVFLQNALSLTKESFYKNKETVTHTKNVFKIVNQLLKEEGTQGMLRDIILTAVVLSDIALNELPDDLKHLHPVAAETILRELKNDLAKPVYDGLLNIIEGHEGEKSPSASLEPKPGQPGFIVALANKIARFDFVTIA
jgi:hypothetical protein